MPPITRIVKPAVEGIAELIEKLARTGRYVPKKEEKWILKDLIEAVRTGRPTRAQELFSDYPRKMYRFDEDPALLMRRGWDPSQRSDLGVMTGELEGLYWAKTPRNLEQFLEQSGMREMEPYDVLSPHEVVRRHVMEGIKLPGTTTKRSAYKKWAKAEQRDDERYLKQLAERQYHLPHPFVETERLRRSLGEPHFVERGYKGVGEDLPELKGFEEIVQLRPQSVIARWNDTIRILGYMGAALAGGTYADYNT